MANKLRTEEYGGGKFKKHYVTIKRGGKGAGKRKAGLKAKYTEKNGKVTHKSGKIAGKIIERARKRTLAEKLFAPRKRTTKDVLEGKVGNEVRRGLKFKTTIQKKKFKKKKSKAK
jgi:hypothetical protein